MGKVERHLARVGRPCAQAMMPIRLVGDPPDLGDSQHDPRQKILTALQDYLKKM